jgi:hypothetical protein
MRSGVIEHMVAPETTLARRQCPEPYGTWQRVDARPATCLDLKLVCRGTQSAGYRQQSLGNSNFAIKVFHIFYLMLSETMYFSSYFLPFQNLYVTESFSLMSFPADVFHAFTEMGGCMGSPTSLTSMMTKCPLGNLFGPRPRLTCDADKAPTRACLAFPSSSSFPLSSCSTFVASSSFSSWFKYVLGL